VKLVGISELNYGDVYGKIDELLAKKDFNFVSRKNFILFPSGKIKSELENTFRKISEVKIEKIFPDSVVVEIVERKALLMWCSAGPCYIVDENGYAYTGADFESDEIKQNNLLSVIDNSGKPVAIGEKVLDDDYIEFVISLKDKLENDTGINVNNEYGTQSKIAEEVRVKTEEGWEIFFSTTLPMEGSIQTLKTFLEKEMADKDKSKLEYVDLRAENKVYYKFKDEEQTDVNAQTNAENTQTSVETKKEDKKKKN
jgi:cell division septal protein FtsQ